MTKLSNITSSQLLSGNFLGIGLMLILSIGLTLVEADDEIPAFFLKIAKNVPRLGRSSGEFEEYSLTSSKDDKHSDYYNEPFVQRQKRKINFHGSQTASSELDSSQWNQFPLAIEGPPELWRTLARYANQRYGTSNEINNDIWQRDRRSASSSSSS